LITGLQSHGVFVAVPTQYLFAGDLALV